MSDPALALQKAEFDALSAYGGIGTGARIYDQPPATPLFPYVVIGEHQVLGDDDACMQNSAVTSRIHIWSRAGGWPEVKQIAANVRDRLRNLPPDPDGFAVIDIKFEQTAYLNDPDGITRHAVVEVTYLISHG